MTENRQINDNSLLKNGKPTIALLLGSMSSTYQEGIMKGVQAKAIELDYNLITFCGGPINDPSPLAQSRETIFELVSKDYIDGIIIPAGAHTRYLPDEGAQAFLGKFNGVPLVCIGSVIEDRTSIISDYVVGISQIVSHFVKAHGYKHIALLRGPKNHISSNVRTDIYKTCLRENGLEIDESLILIADLGENAAEGAIDELLNKRAKNCDAIICVNDSLAVGAIEALNSRGFSVPEDIAICGSLDSPLCLFSSPPLTSVKESTFDLGKEAFVAIHNEINQIKNQSIIKVSTSLTIRQSCGCDTVLSSIKTKNLEMEKPIGTALVDCFQSASLAVNKYQCASCMDSLPLIFAKLKETIESNDLYPLISTLSEEIQQGVRAQSILAWFAVINEIIKALLVMEHPPENQSFLKEMVGTLLSLKEHYEDGSITYKDHEISHYNNGFRDLINSLNLSFDTNTIKSYATSLLNLSDIYLSLFKFDQDKIVGSTNVLAVKDKAYVISSKKQKELGPHQLIPTPVSRYTERFSFLVFPLSYMKRPLGFLVTDYQNATGSAYENMQVIISTALKNNLKIQEIRDAEQRFSDIAHSTTNWLWETDENNVFTYTSSSVQDVLGYSNEEVTGKKMGDFTNSEMDVFQEKMKKRDNIVDEEFWFGHKNYNPVCVVAAGKPIYKDGVFAGYRGAFKDVTEQRIKDERTHYVAFNDTLTNLPNRPQFIEKLDDRILSAQKLNDRFALLFINLNMLTYINDTYGHSTGGLLLQDISKVLTESTRANDIVARSGGDEFTVLLPLFKEENEILHVVKRILHKLEKPVKLESKEIYASLSIGISLFPQDGEAGDMLLKAADDAMLQAKTQGRNQYVFYNKQIEERSCKRSQLERKIQKNLDSESFVIHYQPQINLETNELMGVEALVRMRDGTKLIKSESFIGIAEELGVLDRLDEIVLRNVCSQCKEWQGTNLLPISVNLSSSQLKKRSLFQSYVNILKKYGINPNDICLELKESSLIEEEAIALENLLALKEHGFLISLDDFGSGASSLKSFSLFPIDLIKLSRSFLVDTALHVKGQAIIKGIADIAKSLNHDVIALGVENKEQYELVKSLGCSGVQGFYLHEPLSVEKVSELCLNKNHHIPC